MPFESGTLLVILAGFALAFILARVFGSRWRSRRRDRAEQEARAGESRQARRARERKQRK
jgi:uncharacterized membrane protein YdjX (TVP38/TMEM64 family)